MKANELRINNLVYAYGDTAKIITLAESSCWVEFLIWQDGRSDFLQYDIDTIEPIHLTEEWLLRFGFEKENALPDIVFPDGASLRGSFLVDHYHYRINDFIVNDRFCSHAVEIKYVHSLQNLYFALTGEELTINK